MEKDELQLNPNAESDLKLSNTNIGVDNSDNEFVDMQKLALDAPLQFMAKYNSPREWILDERESAKARIAFAPEDLSTREGITGKVAYGLGGVGYETTRIIPETAQFVLSVPVAIEKTFFPNATETALDRIYNAVNDANQKHRSEREEVVSEFTGDSEITKWTQAFADAATYMIPVISGAKITSKGVKAVAEARKIPAARIGMVTEKAAEKAAGRAIVGTSLAYGLGSSSVESAKQYMQATGASDLSGYNPALDTAVNTVANIVNANIEKSLGFDALVPHLYGSRNALLKGFTENLAKGFVGEFSEEGFQDAVSQIGEMVRGYREFWDFDVNRMAQNAIVGGIVGGTMGGGLYYLNRRAMIRKLEDSGMSHELATDITDSVLTDGIEKTMNNLSAQMELTTQKGQAYEKLKAGIKNALLVQGWNENMIDPMTGKPMNIDEYVELIANNEVARRAVREALQSGISVDEFLDVAQFTAIDNFMIVKPLGTPEQIKARIDEQSAIIKQQQELKKTGAGDSALLSEAKMKKAILQKAYVNAKVNQEIQKVSVEEAKTPEIKQEITTATQDADNLTKTDTVADFNENLDNKTQDGQPITTSQKIKRFGNAVIKKIFGTDKQGFDTVMTLPQYANARNAIVSSADRIFEFAKKHRTYGIYKDLHNALKLLQTVNADNFVEMVKSPDLTGNDVVAQNAFLYHFIFSDANTTSAFINAYLDRAEASITNETGTSLSKKDLVLQAFQATDNLMSTQAQTAGIQYTSIYNEDGSLADENVAAVVMSYQNQFAVDVERVTLYQPEQFDLADENARLDDIYPAYDGETIRIIDPAELKQAQYEVIQRTNPMQDEYHVGIRSVNDIKTFDETIDDKDSFVWGDYSQEDAKRDLAKNEITIYSSKPIENGVFVSTSYKQAQEYAGGKGAKVYEKTVPLDYVAWISGDEGQFAITDVIGKKRTVYNSNGDRIAKSKEALINFWRWFGDSKVVDSQGRPIVMYHGTSNTFDSFDPTTFGYATDSGFFGSGFYFTPIESEARYYGRIVMPVYLKIEKPFVISTGGYYSGLYDNLFEGGGEILKDLGLLSEKDLKDFNKYQKLKNEFLKKAKVEKVYTYDAKHNEVQVWSASFEKNGRTYEGKSYRPWDEIGYNEKEDTKENALNNAWGEYAHFNDLNFLIQDLSFTDYIRTNGLAEELSNIIKSRGYDGTIAGDEHIAFEPTQIKSVDNRGTYSADTGNIYYQAEPTDNPTIIDIEDIMSEYNVPEVIDLVLNQDNIWGTLIDPVKYKSALEEFVKNGKLLHTKTEDVEKWFETIVRNTQILSVITDMAGHGYTTPTYEIMDYFFNGDKSAFEKYKKELQDRDEEIPPEYATADMETTGSEELSDDVAIWKFLEDKGFFDKARLPDGSPAWSDFGLQPLWNIISQYEEGMSAERVLVLINKALDVYHQNGDLASGFIKGGAEVATAISNDYPIRILPQGRKVNGFYDPELSVILLGKNWNTMTLPHELAHYWLDTLFNIYKRVQSGELQANQEWINEKKEMFAMLGIDENQTKLTKGQQEKFAAMTEAYLTGIGVSKDVPQTFKDYFKWVPEKYKSLQQLAYLDENNKVQNVFLDAKAVEFFNRWYGNPTLPSLSTSPERQRYMNVTGDDGEVQKVSIKEMNDREKEFAQDAEEQVHTDERLYNTLDENMPADIKPVADAQKVVISERSNYLKESENQQRRWYERKSRDTEAQLAQEYIEKNPEHAKEVIFGDPELVPNDTGVDRATLINAYMALNNITPDKPEWATLHTNIAINQSLAGTQLALSNDKSYGAYLDALREVENALEMKAATNYAGSKTGARERFNVDIQRFLDRELPSIFATEPNSKEREIALKTMFEKARTTFSGNTTGTFLNQMDMTFAMAQKGKTEAFVKWATNQIKKDAGAKLNSEQQAKLLEISAKAQQALVDLNNPDASKAIAAAQELRKWQVEKDKLMGVSEKKFSLFGFLFGEWAPRAMLASFNTLLVANPPSTALNTFFVNLAKRGELFGENNVSKNLIDNEIARIKKIWKATGMNLAQMEKPTSPSLLHGEKYSTSGQKIYDPYTILGWEDNLFRVPTFVNTLARIASTDAKETGRNADEVFKEYLSLDNPSDSAKLARKQALAVANMAVFTQDGALAKCLNHIRSELNVLSRSLFGLDPKGFGLGNLIAPFLKTGANIAEMGIRGSLAPITTITTMINSWRTGKELDPMKKLALRMDWTYFAFSSVALALLAALTSDDDEFYTDPYVAGRKYDPDKPYDSINIGGVWLDLEIFGPFAIPMRTAAKVLQSWKKDNIGTALGKGYAESAKSVLGDIPLAESIINNQVSYAVKKPSNWSASYVYNQANKLVPAIVKPVSRAVSRGQGWEYNPDWLGSTVGRKFHRNYGFDGAELTTQDLIEILSTKFQLDKSLNKRI